MEPRLIHQQSQKLVLSPQIRQYLKLLQLSIQELEQAVVQEMAENPLLEEKQKDISPEDAAESSETPETNSRDRDNKELRLNESFELFDKLDENFKESFSYTDLSRPEVRESEERRNFQEGLITKPEALSDYLFWQTGFLDFSESGQKISREIIGNIDEDGYLRTPLEEIAQTCGTGVEEVEKVLKQIQELDPPGIAARSLQETLTLQLKKKVSELNDESPKALREELKLSLQIVQEHLPLLEKRDWPHIAKMLGVSAESVKKVAAVIARLDPHPGRSFYDTQSLAVVPDAAIVPNEDEAGKFKIEIFDEKIPEIRISPYYRQMLRSKNTDEQSKAFLKERMQAALNFLQALQLRKSTLRSITEEISSAQSDFLEKGFLHLKPLRLKDIANNLGIHESTVSRAIQGKYIITPQGTIPYKSFFSTRMESSEGPAESQKSIMEKIKILIQAEKPEHPLSDQELLELMKKDGIKVARRTIAKYRELLKILPSHLRRRK